MLFISADGRVIKLSSRQSPELDILDIGLRREDDLPNLAGCVTVYGLVVWSGLELAIEFHLSADFEPHASPGLSECEHLPI